MKLNNIAIHKPSQIAGFEVGRRLWEGELETDKIVESIEVDFFRTVRINLSNGETLVFRGFPISYTK